MSTFRWLCLYLFLWKTSHVVGFLWGWATFATIKRYLFPPTINEVREGNERATKLENDAMRLDQVAEQAGGGSWLEPFTESIGPWAQMQLKDTADFIEILNKLILESASFVTLANSV